MGFRQSALDAGTKRGVFDRLFHQSGNRLHSDAAVVLITVDGGVSFSGSWNELTRFRTEDPESKLAVESIQNAVQEDRGAVRQVRRILESGG